MIKKIKLFVLMFYSFSVYATVCTDSINTSLFIKDLHKKRVFVNSDFITEFFNRSTKINKDTIYEDSIVIDLNHLFKDHSDVFLVLNNVDLSIKEKLNILSYLARLYNKGEPRDEVLFNNILNNIKSSSLDRLKKISVKYNEFRQILDKAYKEKLYTIFGDGKYYSDGIDVSIVYLELLARDVLDPTLTDLKEDILLKTVISDLGDKLQDLLLFNPIVGHTGRDYVGKIRKANMFSSKSGVEQGFREYFEDFSSVSKKLIIVQKYKDPNGVESNLYSYRYLDNQGLTIGQFNNLNRPDKNTYKDLEKLLEKYDILKEDFDFVYAAPILDSKNRILTVDIKIQDNNQIKYKILHTEPYLVEEIINDNSQLFKDLLNSNYNNVSNDEFQTKIAQLYWSLMNAMPYYRGSASLIDVLVKSIYLKHGFGVPIYPERLDYKAFSTSMDAFVEFYKNLNIKIMSNQDFKEKVNSLN